MQISVECDDPDKSSAVFYLLLMKYRWSHALCWTAFLRNQLLCPKTLATFPLSGDFRLRARQWNRSSFTDVHFWICNYMGRKTNICRFCSLITQISYFVIPKVCLSKCVFHFRNLKLEYLFEEIYAWVRAHFPKRRLVIEPQAKNRLKESSKGSLSILFLLRLSKSKYSSRQKLYLNTWDAKQMFIVCH